MGAAASSKDILVLSFLLASELDLLFELYISKYWCYKYLWSVSKLLQRIRFLHKMDWLEFVKKHKHEYKLSPAQFEV